MLARTLLLLALVGAATAVFNTTIHRHESYRSMLMREQRWEELRLLNEYKKTQHRHFGQELAGGVSKQPFYDYSDAAYTGHIVIGAAKAALKQVFNVILDTGSSNLWVTDKTCDNGAADCEDICEIPQLCQFLCNPECCDAAASGAAKLAKAPTSSLMNVLKGKKLAADGPCDNKAQFDSDKSSSYKKDGRTWSIQYGTGSASGFLGVDSVKLGDENDNELTVPGCVFGQADHLARFFTDQPLDGILGLAFRQIAEDDVQPVFQHAVEQKLVDRPIFTVWLKADGGSTQGKVGGQITYGGYDEEHCAPEAEITWVKITHPSWWLFDLDGVAVNGKKTNGKWSAISDTGTSLIAGPRDLLQSLAKAAGATFQPQYGLYVLECDSKFSWSVFVGGKEFRISSDNLVIEAAPGLCILGFQEWSGGGGAPDFILGDPFVRQFCQTHDTEKAQIGFSDAKA